MAVQTVFVREAAKGEGVRLARCLVEERVAEMLGAGNGWMDGRKEEVGEP